MAKSRAAIPSQSPLPLRVAFGVVMQGIRIRLGRSLVTLAGVTLGVAFLMASLTSQLLRRGVVSEDRLRDDANRRYARLVSEAGPLADRRLTLVVTGPLSEVERRLLRRIEADGPRELRLAPGSALEPGLLAREPSRAGRLDFAEQARAIIVLGGGSLPDLDWSGALATARQPLVARAAEGTALVPGAPRQLLLAVRPSSSELAARTAEEGRSRARTLWIVAISLLVTVMGITNAMLMSVTERFRDIGTMRCLGALSSFVRTVFLLEAACAGCVGGVLGAALGAAASALGYLLVYGPALVGRALGAELGALTGMALLSALAGLLLTLLSALYPAARAARMLPADALRSHV